MMTLNSARRSMWLVPAGLVLLSLVPALAGTSRLFELAGQPEVTAANARFVAMPLPVMLHILAAVPFSILGAFQFSQPFRRRFRAWHRAAGRVLVALGLLTALTGLWMTLFYPWADGDGRAVYLLRLLFGSAMFASIIAGIQAIRRRDFTAHGEWMIRGYAIGLGAGTQVLTHIPWFLLAGRPDELGRSVAMGAGWIINVMVAESVIRSATKRRQHPAATAGDVPGRRRGAHLEAGHAG